MTEAVSSTTLQRAALTPTLTKQCVGFMIGSSLFALGSALALGGWASAATSNACYFVGAWFFTAAGMAQLLLSGAVTVPVSYGRGSMVRAEWLAAATQSFGTLLFNVSTTAALGVRTISAEKHYVWSPDAGGSVAFLVSGVLVIVAYNHVNNAWSPRDRQWWSTQINFVGCVAFGISAVGAYILTSGDSVNNAVANVGTLVGALCFFFASLVVLPLTSRARGGPLSTS
ncbi:hypothetical protein [Mumia zhuanghuii]|uniref:YrhK domain-containing protein n=1 Tax=Mumia zhuanghuii TaxID=2585211 RepID=A0A5C4M9Y9_9ACTN|nr:hypothetical protein [Mumia zhuanghuii]TNC31683.1 hypothetical protein FHE65_31045 [Mumia zhuanghuii]TNC42410.1 hypothetical protein FHE65_21045 [Mumia zhuanghuii]